MKNAKYICHIEKYKFSKTFSKLVECVYLTYYNKGYKIHVLCDSEQIMLNIDSILWTYEQLKFLPHGTEKDSSQEDQPILLITKIHNSPERDILIVVSDNEARIREMCSWISRNSGITKYKKFVIVQCH